MNLWMLRRLKKLGASQKILIDIYNKHIRSILEYAVPVWGSLLTNENCDDIERVQKCAYTIIFGHSSSTKLLMKSKNVTLSERRTLLFKKFAVQSASSENFSTWFRKRPQIVNTRKPNTYVEVPARCERWMSSPIPMMTTYLNNLWS